jgi:hypothetical protein
MYRLFIFILSYQSLTEAFIIEGDEIIDPFSSITIQYQSSAPINDSLVLSPDHYAFESITENQNLQRQKLKPRRKGKEITTSSSK